MTVTEFRPATEAEVYEIRVATFASRLADEMEKSIAKAETYLAEILAESGPEFYADVIKQMRLNNALDLKARGEAMIEDGKRLVALADQQLSDFEHRT